MVFAGDERDDGRRMYEEHEEYEEEATIAWG